AEITFTIGLKCDPLAVGRPNGEAVSPAERQAIRCIRASKVKQPDIAFSAFLYGNRDTLPIGRNARCLVVSCRQLQGLHNAVAVGEGKIELSRSRLWTRNINERAVVREAEFELVRR